MTKVKGRFNGKLISRQSLTRDVEQFVFEKKNLPEFFPGQYVDVFLPINKKEDVHSFTISSSPTEQTFSITTKKGISAFKAKLFYTKPGTTLFFSGPHGGFYLKDKPIIPHVFIAGGIGITPFRSIIRFAADNKLKVSILLIVAFSKREDMIFFDELQSIAKKNPDIKIVYVIATPDTQWKGEKGHISQELLKKYVLDIKKAVFFISGSIKMVDDIQKILMDTGVVQDNIQTDYFIGY